MGTPHFAVPALSALIKAGHEIASVFTQPPRPSGRGHPTITSPVHSFSDASGIKVENPTSLKGKQWLKVLSSYDPEVIVVAAYGLLLPKQVLQVPRKGCLNIHASLLPRWRGAAPIQRAIIAGDTVTGVTIMQMETDLDAGPILMVEKTKITNTTTAGELHDTLAQIGAILIVKALSEGIDDGYPQSVKEVTYAPKLKREEGKIDWHDSADLLHRKVRALYPWPGVWCEHAGERLRVLEATIVDGAGNPGNIIGEPLVVACGTAALRLDRVQRDGKNVITAEDYLRGRPALIGTSLK
tara:strand:- start:55 stop:945 length:891 start_codon:yes stop_codon:yes gene_type:complete